MKNVINDSTIAKVNQQSAEAVSESVTVQKSKSLILR